MKFNMWNLLEMVAVLVVGIASVIQLTMGYMIPGLSPFALGFILFCIYKDENQNKSKWLRMILLVAIGMNILAGVSQLLAAFR